MDDQERARQVELAAKGDQDALQRLIVEYHATLRAVVDREFDSTVRRHLDPDDILQEAYTSAFRTVSTGQFDGAGAFYKWLETIALNALKNRRRGLKALKRDVAREVHCSVEAATSYPDLIHRLATSDTTPSRRVARNEAAAAVLSSLARLSDDQRDVIRLRYLEGKSVAEVASRLGKTEAAVHGLCRRGIRALRESLVSISRFLTRL